MKLSETVVNKYNLLFSEVAKHYGMSKDNIGIIPSMGLLHPFSLDWDMSMPDKIRDNFNLLEKSYPYLKPFYKIFISMWSNTYQYKFINSETFIEINDVIKEIRKENSETYKGGKIDNNVENIYMKFGLKRTIHHT